MAAPTNGAQADKSHFEQQRELIIGDSLENVLQNINKLNRSLEGVIAVGNEFSQVEGLWSQFENVMAKEPEDNQDEQKDIGEGAPDDRPRF